MSGIVRKTRESRSVGGNNAAKSNDIAYAKIRLSTNALYLIIFTFRRIVKKIGNWNPIPIRSPVIITCDKN